MGVQRVRQELRQHQLPDELINDACAELKEDEAQRLFALWMRRFGEKPATPQEQARQMRFFHGRGFSSDSIRHLFRQVSQLSQTECADNGD
jgi:regulatory protein